MNIQESYTKPCVICGEKFTYTYATKRMKYCPKCRIEAQRQSQARIREQNRIKRKLEERAEVIAHQQDTSIWTHDYAERQKAKTLAMIGGIK